MFLRSWWSKTYNRPLKDPILESYTLYELLYEYHDKAERINAIEAILDEETGKIEEEREQETLDWIEEEERKEAEADAEKARKTEEAEKADEEWMLKELKKEHGDDFGEDVSLDF